VWSEFGGPSRSHVPVIVPLAAQYPSFDTICSATQDRQDAVKQLVDGGLGMMIVTGGRGQNCYSITSNGASVETLCPEGAVIVTSIR
jgi:4-hydroxy-3-methylbut-2-enyl diphosphate reductase IspH